MFWLVKQHVGEGQYCMPCENMARLDQETESGHQVTNSISTEFFVTKSL